MHKAHELASILRPFAGEWGYIYGTAGETWTEAKQAALPAGSKYELARQYGAKWIGRHVADCSGLVKYGCSKLGISMPHGSNSQWRGCLGTKGEIRPGFMPTAGMLVFKLRNGDDFYHVGVSLGDGRVVEAQGTRAGVVISELGSGWSHYGLIRGLDYSITDADPAPAAAGGQEPKAGTMAIVMGGRLNVRARTSRAAEKLTQLPTGTCVEVLETDGKWSHIRYSQEGYVLNEYLEVAD